VRAREQAGLEGFLPGGERPLEIERTDHTIFGRAQGQVDDRHRRLDGAGMRPLGKAFGAVVAPLGRGSRIAAVLAPLNHLHGRQESGESPHGGTLAGATITEDHDPADGGIDRHEEEGQLHLLLSHNGAERINRSHQVPEKISRGPETARVLRSGSR
jgi:hypothetical protein